MRSTARTIAVALAATVLLTACTQAERTGPEEEVDPVSQTIDVTAIDYGYTGLPASVAAGSKFTLRNNSDTQLHELVAIRLPDSESRPIDDLMALPEQELGQLLSGEPATVILAEPGQDGEVWLGDGSVQEPGRYLVACFVPTDADPAEYLAAAEAAQGEAPTGVAGGPPHFVQGMYRELTVQ